MGVWVLRVYCMGGMGVLYPYGYGRIGGETSKLHDHVTSLLPPFSWHVVLEACFHSLKCYTVPQYDPQVCLICLRQWKNPQSSTALNASLISSSICKTFRKTS